MNQWMEMLILNSLSLTLTKNEITNIFDYNADDDKNSLPFINYLLEDKSKYPALASAINPYTNKNYIDRDSDFLIGDSGGILPKWDFIFVNTWKFTEAADYYTKYGKYTLHPKDSIEYKKFWARELSRRKRGLTRKCRLYFKDIKEYFDPKTTSERKNELLHPIRITGDFYNYLNYGRIERVPNEEEMQKLKREGLSRVKTIEAFPRFWDGDYWAYKIEELAVDNESNNITAKARRKGFSYKRGNKGANTVNLIPKATIINVADDLAYLTDSGALTYMMRVNLDWFENQTYWKRGYVSEKMEEIELGYKLKKESNKKFGHRSRILSYSIAKNTSVAIGKKAIEINVEEAGKCPNMKEFIEVTLSNLESGAFQIGTFNIWGTGGTKGTNWEDFERIFRNPRDIKALAFENIFDYNMRHEVCGWFHPQVLNLEPYVFDGNTLFFDAYIYDKKDKEYAKSNKANDDYIVYCAQRANTPSEAFINTIENLFASPELNKHATDVKIDARYQYYTDGWYVTTPKGVEFYDRERCISEKLFGGKFHEYILDVPHNKKTDVHGCVREYFRPIRIEGAIPKNLYFITVDPYGVDKKSKEVTDKYSLYTFTVWMRSNTVTPFKGKIPIAFYAGRLNTMKENDKLLLAACMRWNAKALVERNRGETITNFKTWGATKYLLTDPTAYVESSVITEDKRTDYGMSVSDFDTKYNGLTLLKDYVYEILDKSDGELKYRLYDIHDLPTLLELQRFIYGGNFDRISNFILAMYEFKKDEFIKRKIKVPSSNDNARSLNKRLTRS